MRNEPAVAPELRLHAGGKEEEGGWPGRAPRPAPGVRPASPDDAVWVRNKVYKISSLFLRSAFYPDVWAGGQEPHRPARRAHIAPSPGRLQKAAGGESEKSTVDQKSKGRKKPVHSQIIILAKLLEERHPRPLLHPLQSPDVSRVLSPRSDCCKLCFLRRVVCKRTWLLRALRRRAVA